MYVCIYTHTVIVYRHTLKWVSKVASQGAGITSMNTYSSQAKSTEPNRMSIAHQLSVPRNALQFSS
jgi:hypothetical protein